MRTLLFLLFFPCAAMAAGEGAWQASNVGTLLAHRGVSAASEPLAPPYEVSGTMSQVIWRYSLAGPIPEGLQVQLCSLTRCVAIDGGQGMTRGFTGVSASEPLRFIWSVSGRGSLSQELRVKSNQVIVNYQ